MDQIKLQPTIKIVSTICPYLNIMDFIKIKSCIMHKITAQGKTDWVIVTWRVENNDVKTKEKNMPGNLPEYKMTTNTNCPSCDNEDVYLVHCHKSVWKVCEKCKKVFDCSDDSGGNLTDVGMHEWLEKNKDKDIGDYKEEKCKFMTKKYFDYKMFKHPDIHNDPNLEYAEVTSNKPSSRLNF